MTVSTNQIAKHFLKRTERLELMEKRLRKSAMEDLPKLVEILTRNYQVCKVILFGSLTAEKFHSRSDIDLAVEGLESRKFFKAVGDCLSISHVPVDLVRIEDASSILKKRIEEEGRILYDRKGKD